MSYTQQDQSTNLYGQQPVVVVKVRPGAPLVAAVSQPPQGGDGRRNAEALMERVRQRYPGATIEHGITCGLLRPGAEGHDHVDGVGEVHGCVRRHVSRDADRRRRGRVDPGAGQGKTGLGAEPRRNARRPCRNPNQEDTQYETMARASAAEDDEYSSTADPAVHDIAQSYPDVGPGNGDHDDTYDSYS